MRILARAIAAVLAIAAFFLAGEAARAHAALVSSEPADGAMVASSPSRFTLTFNEPVAPLVLRLVTASGSTLLTNPSGRQTTLLVTPLPQMPFGTHVLSWRVVSLDGHPVSGSVVFSIGAPSAGPLPDAENTATSDVAALLWVAKVSVYIGLFIGIGGAFFGAWIGPHGAISARRPIVAALAIGFVALPLSVGVQGLDALGLPLSGLGEKIAWVAGFETSYGLTAVAASFSLCAGLFSLAAGSARVARALSMFGLLGVGFALALSGHASAAEPQWLMRPAVLVHATCLAFWIGALIPLADILRRNQALDALARFSRAIPYAIVALVLSGAVLALVQIGTPNALVSTAYGRLLCAKLSLVAVLLLVAAWNRFRVTAAVVAGREAAQKHLVRSICVEVVLVVLIFGLVAAWRFTPPPRSIEIAASRPANLHIHSARAMVDLTLMPGRAGLTRLSMMLMSGDFGGLDAKELSVTFRNEPAGIEPIVRSASRDSSGYWIVDGFLIPVPGRWNVDIDILVNDFEKITLDGTIDVRP